MTVAVMLAKNSGDVCRNDFKNRHKTLYHHIFPAYLYKFVHL